MKVDKSLWQEKKLSDFFDLQMGKTPSRKDLSLWENGDTSWVSISDMKNKRNISESKELLPYKTILECKIPIIPQGTVIMSFKLTIGATCIVAKPLATNEAIMAFFPKKGVDVNPSFLAYSLSALKWKGNRAVKGLTINKKTISQKLFSLPPLGQQNCIASELDALQEVIDGYKAQIADLDALAQSIFLDTFGDPISNPKGWNVSLLKDLCSMITDGTHLSPKWTEQGIPFIFVSNVKNYTISLDVQRYIDEKTYDGLWKSTPVEMGDIVYTSVGSYGNPAIVRDNKKFMFQRHIALLKPFHDLINNQYLVYFLTSPSGKKQADDKVIGAAQKTLNLKAIKQFNVLVPPKELQERFAHQVEAIEQQKALLRQQLADAEMLMAERMQYYFS